MTDTLGKSDPVVGLIEQRLSALAPELIQIYDESAEHAGHAGAAAGGGHYSSSWFRAGSKDRPVWRVTASSMRRSAISCSAKSTHWLSPHSRRRSYGRCSLADCSTAQRTLAAAC